MPTMIYKTVPVKLEGPEGASTEELVDLYLSRKSKKEPLMMCWRRTEPEEG